METSKQAGFSLVQVMVASALMGGLALVLMKLQDNSSQISKTAEVNQALHLFSQEIAGVMSNGQNCTETFKNLELDTTERAISQVKKVKNDGSVIIVYSVGQEYQSGQLLLESITYKETVDEFLEVRFGFKKLSAIVAGGKNITKILKLQFEKDAGNKIIRCADNAAPIGGFDIISGEEAGMSGLSGIGACASKGKVCAKVMSYNFIRVNSGCGSDFHCLRVCSTWYNQSLPGVENGSDSVGTPKDNIHSCDALLGEYTTYLHAGVVRCNAFFSAVCN